MEPANDWGKNERVRSTNNKCSYSWLCCTHTSTTFSSSSMSIPFDTQQYRCCRLSAFAEIMYIFLYLYMYTAYIYIYIPFGFIRGTEFNIVSLFYFTFFSSHALFPLSLNKLCSGSRRLLRAIWKIVYSVLCERRTVRTKIDGRTLNSSSKIGRCSLFIISVANTIRILWSKPVYPLLWPSSG